MEGGGLPLWVFVGGTSLSILNIWAAINTERFRLVERVSGDFQKDSVTRVHGGRIRSIMARVSAKMFSIKGNLGNKASADIPFLVDLLTVCTDGGMNLQQAMERIAAIPGCNYPVLSEIVRRTKLGKSIIKSVEDVASLWRSGELLVLVRALRLGLALGVPINEILQQVAALLRSRQRLALQKRLAITPLKLTFSALVFFYPPIFVVILLPHVLSFLRGQW